MVVTDPTEAMVPTVHMVDTVDTADMAAITISRALTDTEPNQVTPNVNKESNIKFKHKSFWKHFYKNSAIKQNKTDVMFASLI